jgi:hypothetical protein
VTDSAAAAAAANAGVRAVLASWSNACDAAQTLCCTVLNLALLLLLLL